MHSSTFYALFLAASVSAETAVVYQPWNAPVSSLTVKGSDSSATTYVNNCPSSSGAAPSSGSAAHSVASSTGAAASSGGAASSAAGSAAGSSIAAASTLALTPITGIPTNFPMPTGSSKFRRLPQILRRQDDADICVPFTIVQGPSTWEGHYAMTGDNGFSLDGGCKFSGGIGKGDATCSVTKASGAITAFITGETSIPFTTTLKASDFNNMNTVTLVSGSGAASGASGSNSGSTAKATGTGAQATGSATGSAAGAKSSGAAAHLALPTGAAAFVGGAAGILVAAIAL